MPKKKSKKSSRRAPYGIVSIAALLAGSSAYWTSTSDLSQRLKRAGIPHDPTTLTSRLHELEKLGLVQTKRKRGTVPLLVCVTAKGNRLATSLRVL